MIKLFLRIHHVSGDNTIHEYDYLQFFESPYRSKLIAFLRAEESFDLFSDTSEDDK